MLSLLHYYSAYFIYTCLPVIFVGFYCSIENYLKKSWMRSLCWIAIIAIVIVVGWQASYHRYWYDFYKAYFYAGRRILQNSAGLYGQSCVTGYVNFPLLAYVFVPLTWIAPRYAGRVFFLIGYAALIPLTYWLIKVGKLRGWKRSLMLLLIIVNGPLDYSIRLGNTTHLIMLSVVILFWCIQRKKAWLAGILLAINGLIKIPLILPTVYFVFRRRWRVVASLILLVTLVIGASFLFVPASLNVVWLNKCIISYTGTPIAAYNNQSLTGVLARQLIPESVTDSWIPLDPTVNFKIASYIALIVLSLPVIFVLIHKWKLKRSLSEFLLEFSIVMVFSLLASPISWVHYFMLLLIPTALYLGGEINHSQKTWNDVLLGVSVLFFSIPIDLSLDLFQKTGQRFFLSLNFFGGLLLYVNLLALWFYRQFDRSEINAERGFCGTIRSENPA